MSNYVERIKLLTELFDEGHITEQEFGELVGSIRGGAVNEAYDQTSKDKVTIGGYDLIVEGDEQWLEEVNNPNKLDEYEAFFNNDDSEFKPHEYFDNSENYYKWKRDRDLYDPAFTDNSINGLAKQDVYSGSILKPRKDVTVYGCDARYEKGELICNHPFISFENNEPTPVKEHPAYHKILQAVRDGKIVLE